MKKQKSLAIYILVVLSILLSGCGPLTQEAGSTHHYSKKIAFYLAPSVTEEDLAAVRQPDSTLTDDYLTQYIAWYWGKYIPLTDEILSSLTENTEWQVTEGFVLSNPQVSVEPVQLIWEITEGNYINTRTMWGFMGVFEADVTMPASGEGVFNCEVTLRNFSLLNLFGSLIGQKIPIFPEATEGRVYFENTDYQRYYPSPVVIDVCNFTYKIKP